MNMFFVAIGGFFGAMARFAVGNAMKLYYKGKFPYATLMVNIIGSWLLGLLIGAEVRKGWYLLVGTGFMGAFTTFSTFNLESIQLLKEKKALAMIYIGMSYIIGIFAAFLGFSIGAILK